MDPTLICRLESGFLCLAENQFLRGYCLLLAFPKVDQLLSLEPEQQAQFLRDMARAGEAVKRATQCVRVNFAIYGNLDPFLHAHIWPRYSDEAEALRTIPPLSFPLEVRTDHETQFSESRHGDLISHLRQLLTHNAE